MAYYSRKELIELGFKYLGKDVKVSKNASIYDHHLIEIDDFSRIDDFCLLSGKVRIGKYCHITPMCLIAGGNLGVCLDDFVTLAYGVKLFSQSDDYSGLTMTNSLIPKEYKNEKFAKVVIKKHSILGANSTVLPGVTINEGCAIGAMTLVTKSLDSWGIYTGVPAKRIRTRSRKLEVLEQEFLEKKSDD